ncbi:hypothetical protein Lser_V15G35812 [Lactuca serriola]
MTSVKWVGSSTKITKIKLFWWFRPILKMLSTYLQKG